MAVANLLAALHLPEAARVDKRIAKTLLAENSAATPTDKRLIQDAIEEYNWVAALKPQTIGVAAYVDASVKCSNSPCCASLCAAAANRPD